MCPRRYRADRRQAAAEGTRRRIIEATVALHAERGAMATTYAMIAKRADVAIPTVYNHFPEQGALFAACTGHAALNAPDLDEDIYQGAADVLTRLGRLVRALDGYYQYYRPWLRRGIHEAALLPDLAAALQANFADIPALIELALRPGFETPPPKVLVALCETLLDFSAWQRLADDPDMPAGERDQVLVDALAALVGRHGGNVRQT